MLVLAALIFPVLATQTPPCVGQLQEATPLSSSVSGYTMQHVQVSGPSALSLGESMDAAGLRTVHMDAYAFGPLTGSWTAQQALSIAGRVYPSAGESFDMEGPYAAFARIDQGQASVTVLERDPAGVWFIDDVISVPTNRVENLRVSDGRVAIGVNTTSRIEIWADSANGWILDGVIQELPGTTVNFTTEFDLEGERLVSNGVGLGLQTYRRQSAGNWVREQVEPNLGSFVQSQWFEPAFAQDGRWAQAVRASGSPADVGVGFWRVSSDALPTRSIFDGVLLYADIPAPITTTLGGAFGGGTFIAEFESPSCPPGPGGARRALAVIEVGESDVPRYVGTICGSTGGSTPAQLGDFDYDGGTLAATLHRIGTSIPPSVQFTSLPGASYDRNADCTLDYFELVQSPRLDVNGNGILDSTETRGTSHCLPLVPNSSGNLAVLEVIGTEFYPTIDLGARIQGLPASTFGFLAVARTPAPIGPFGIYGLCIGSGPISAFGRYPVFLTGAQGDAFAALPSSAFQGPAHVPGDTWGWQYIYRDGSGFRTGPAVRVTLE